MCCYYEHNNVYAKIADYLQILTDKEVKHYVVINFGEFYIYEKKLDKELGEEQNLRNVTESFHTL